MTTEQAAELRALHVPGKPLVLPNVWDAASARAVEAAGFPAIATGSSAVAAVLGYDDGEATPVHEMMAAVARIVRVAGVPVTADVERGYGLSPAELVERLAATGAVGCNLEDSDPRTKRRIDVEEQADFLATVRQASADLVVNARVDTFIRGDASLSDAVLRGRRYLEAGADCVYPIGVAAPGDIKALSDQLDGRVNILFHPGTPTLSELADLGVARISFGHGLHEASHAYATTLITTIRDGGNPYP
ncbi:isocitrate lyase/phosphoenolpyruvate mutase family protein [Nonomuraea sp. NPDC046570]|uniref:isocitrate lyase/PEP mutase family protein n=1 Tax=Nonomuraea sp. NPDC046570 TaxID=3155255 RepID=UPI0033CF0D6D